MQKEIIFIGGGLDFHAIDWYRTIREVNPGRTIWYVTDMMESEGHKRILKDDDQLIPLYYIDRFLFNRESDFGNIWRNIIKLAFFPLQVMRLRAIHRRYPHAVYHAHTMYYMFIAWLAGLPFMGSPQGDEILVRPQKSFLYRYFAIKALRAAKQIVVDSVGLKTGIKSLSGKDADVWQYGIDVDDIRSTIEHNEKRSGIASIRAWYPLYQIHEIIAARDRVSPEIPIHFFYPFYEEGYREKIKESLSVHDQNHGRLPSKHDMYRLLASCKLAISIPNSDSSPRSVYEAIFCGCMVAVRYNTWIESLPGDMRSRVIVVNTDEVDWFKKAVDQAGQMASIPFKPSEDALNMFDQKRSMKMVSEKYYH